MEFQKVIETRRSIRKYDGNKKASKEQIAELIAAANDAPTWKNSQTGRYYCVISDEMQERLKSCMPEFNANRSEGASALIVTTYVKNISGYESDGVTPTNEFANGWGAYDLGLQSENLLLKATEMGLGTLVMGIRDEAKIRTLLNIPENEIIVSVIAVGYPDQEAKKPLRKAVDDIAKFY